MLNQSLVVQTQPKSRPTHHSQGHVISRQINPLETVVLFKVAETIPLFLAVGKMRVEQVWYTPLGARFHRLCDERIRRRLVPMADHGDNLHQTCLLSIFVADEFGETYESAIQEGPNEDTAIEERTVLSAHGLKVLVVVSKPLSLPRVGFIVHIGDALHTGSIERYFANCHAALFRSTDHIPGLRVDLLRPPIIKGGNSQRS
jgi:hypothetical protein